MGATAPNAAKDGATRRNEFAAQRCQRWRQEAKHIRKYKACEPSEYKHMHRRLNGPYAHDEAESYHPLWLRQVLAFTAGTAPASTQHAIPMSNTNRNQERKPSMVSGHV
eukprot:9114439-Lingulodinium_polyedra.AAC.1